MTVKTPSGERVITGSHILAAAGRSPNTETLNLEAAGVRTEKGGFIAVNERLETSAPGIWALGDVKGGPAFTHISYDDYRIIRANLLEGGSRTIMTALCPTPSSLTRSWGAWAWARRRRARRGRTSKWRRCR